MSRPVSSLLFLLVLSGPLAGCDQLGIESPEKIAAARDADGKAIGGACRHAMRAIEDCYSLNKKADRAAVFAGWREMNDYMRENKLDGVLPVTSTEVAVAKPAESEDAMAAAAASGTEDGKKGATKVAKGDKTDKAEKTDKAH